MSTKVTLVSITNRNGNYQIKFSGKIKERQQSLLSMLNKDDDRFQGNQKDSFAWINKATKLSIIDVFGIDENNLPSNDESIEYNLPAVTTTGVEIQFEEKETIEIPSDLKDLSGDAFIEAVSKRAKQYTDRNTQEVKYFVDVNGNPIFRRVEATASAPKHVKIEATEVSKDEFLQSLTVLKKSFMPDSVLTAQ